MSTFISYSRVNSAFVVRLARDLKAAGYDVWLDQLDIPKGARWDDEIEAAVERASTFMIVLAPESMESQNVKDELSYAIDSGKYILPVVIKPCKMPLRLRRFQYVDFTDKPYKDSLADIKHLLSNTRPAPKPAPVEDAPLIEPEDAFVTLDQAMAQRELASNPVPLKTERLEAESSRRKYIVPAVLVAIAAIAVIGVFAASASRNNRNVPPPVAADTSTATTQPPPTETPTITPTPLPRQVTDFQGVTMMLVNSGEFIMGDENGAEDEKMMQKLFLSDFYIDRYEVTNASYKDCVQAGQCQPPLKDASRTYKGYFSRPEFKRYPVVNVTWEMASDYCTWRGARLPTEAEWEKAARGSTGNIYPWGRDISCDQSNFSGCGKDTQPVSSFESGQSPYEVFDMAGNVSEWVNSLYANYPYESAREDPMASGARVVRGGSFADNDQLVRAPARQKADPTKGYDNIGFRCVGLPKGFENKPTLVTVTPTPNLATKNAKKEDEQTGNPLLVTPLPGTTVPPALLTPTDASPTPTEASPTPTDASPTPTEASPTPTDGPPTPTDEPPTPTDEPPTPTDEPPTPTDEPPTPTDEPPTPTDEPPTPAAAPPT